jgi:hypothetical protein
MADEPKPMRSGDAAIQAELEYHRDQIYFETEVLQSLDQLQMRMQDEINHATEIANRANEQVERLKKLLAEIERKLPPNRATPPTS